MICESQEPILGEVEGMRQEDYETRAKAKVG
jgi:hypothetical protein